MSQANSDKSPNINPQDTKSKSSRVKPVPVVVPGRLSRGLIVARKDLITNIHIDGKKLTELGSMETGGLYPLETDTAAHYYWSDEVIDFWLNRPRRKLTPKNSSN